jgi:glycosyltransferase 2 family protein
LPPTGDFQDNDPRHSASASPFSFPTNSKSNYVTDSTLPTRRWLLWMLRLLVLALVCLGVSGTVRSALAQLSQRDWHVRWEWLIVAGIFYVIGLAPIAWFFQRALAALGYPTPFSAALRAYFLGHVGKYVPGKAIAVLMRVIGVRRWVPSWRVVLVAAFLDTIIMMAAGALLAAVLSAFVLRSEPYIWLLAAGMAVATGAPTCPPILRWLARIGIAKKPADERMEPRSGAPASTALNLHGIDLALLAKGWVVSVFCWVLLGLSLGATMRGIGVSEIQPINDLPLMIVVIAFSVVAGFLSFLPGGLGVRDAILMQLLVPRCGEANAFIAAVLVRLVWLVSELFVCGILYVGAVIKSRRE